MIHLLGALKLIKYALLNLLVSIINLFIHRDNQVILFGSWMGDRFADNSRFWYQYLHLNKEKFNLRKVIWVTRDQELCNLLSDTNYEVYIINSFRGIYWHLKAGIHVVCNTYAQAGKYKGDINGQLSCGAIKIQLWHGVGIKACNLLSINNNPQGRTFLQRMKMHLKNYKINKIPFLHPGCWNRLFFLSTSTENSRVIKLDFGIDKENIIEANYPRLCKPLHLFNSEYKVLNEIKNLKDKGLKLVLYLPTFREKSLEASKYISPLDISGFREFLKHNDIYWLEKQHSVSNITNPLVSGCNTYFIEPNFDINILYSEIDLLITDYSSASSDCIYKGIKTLSYIPDYEYYRDNERGFVSNYYLYNPGPPEFSPDNLKNSILYCLSDQYFSVEMQQKYDKTKALLFDNNPADMEWISFQIFDRIRK